MIRVNFTNSFTRSCTPNDYYMWTPYDAVSLFIVVYCCLLLFIVVYCCLLLLLFRSQILVVCWVPVFR